MQKAYESSGNILFEETQRFPVWIRILVTVIAFSSVLITAVTSIAIAVSKNPDRGDAWIPLAITLPLESLLLFIFFKARLEKIVTSNGLYYRWTPWQRRYRFIEESEIEKTERRKSPFSYGTGWVAGYGRINNLSNRGIQVFLHTGKKFFFGTDEEDAFEKALEHLLADHRKTNFSEF